MNEVRRIPLDKVTVVDKDGNDEFDPKIDSIEIEQGGKTRTITPEEGRAALRNWGINFQKGLNLSAASQYITELRNAEGAADDGKPHDVESSLEQAEAGAKKLGIEIFKEKKDEIMKRALVNGIKILWDRAEGQIKRGFFPDAEKSCEEIMKYEERAQTEFKIQIDKKAQVERRALLWEKRFEMAVQGLSERMEKSVKSGGFPYFRGQSERIVKLIEEGKLADSPVAKKAIRTIKLLEPKVWAGWIEEFNRGLAAELEAGKYWEALVMMTGPSTYAHQLAAHGLDEKRAYRQIGMTALKSALSSLSRPFSPRDLGNVETAIDVFMEYCLPKGEIPHDKDHQRLRTILAEIKREVQSQSKPIDLQKFYNEKTSELREIMERIFRNLVKSEG